MPTLCFLRASQSSNHAKSYFLYHVSIFCANLWCRTLSNPLWKSKYNVSIGPFTPTGMLLLQTTQIHWSNMISLSENYVDFVWLPGVFQRAFLSLNIVSNIFTPANAKLSWPAVSCFPPPSWIMELHLLFSNLMEPSLDPKNFCFFGRN